MRSFKMREWVAVVVALAVVAILFFGKNAWQFLSGKISIDQAAVPITNNLPTESKEQMTNISTTPGLEIYDIKVGTGAEAISGKTIFAHYIGTLSNGIKFDSSLDRGQPFEFDLGQGKVIKGWDLGLVGMKVGGKRKLVISPELAYGNQGIGPIPANSTLTFEVELVSVR